MTQDISPSPLAGLNQLYSRLGSDPDTNIALIVEATATLLRGACALFNRLDHKDRSLCTWSAVNAPEDLPERDNPEGHICYEGTIKGQDKPVVVPDIQQTHYAQSDPNVVKYGLRSYLGYPVRLQGQAIGALCIVDLKVRDFSEDEVDLISTLAKAISLEEERKRIADQYRTSQDMVSQMQRLATIGGWTMNPQTQDVVCTEELNRILEIPPQEALPDAAAFLSLCTTSRDRRRVRIALEKIRSGPAPQTLEVRIRTRAGTYKWVRLTGQSRFENGEAAAVLGSLQDISAYKEIEARLQEAKEAAEQANRAKSQFLASMSHEVRTPLNGVLGMLQLVLRTELTEEQKEYVEVGLHSCRGLLTVINDLLDLSKIEAGKLTLAEAPMSLSDIIGSVCRGLAPQAMEQGVRLTYAVDSRIPEFLLGDGDRLNQILFNLVGNAVKFTPGGSIRLDVSPIFRSRTQTRILITVADTGVGIPDEALERIIEPFEQVDAPLTGKTRGTGLGLGIVRKLVELMEGTLSINSEPDRGTTVYVSLPLKLTETDRPDLSEAAREKSGNMRLLLVEDNPVNQAAAKVFLEKLGNTVDTAENGLEALEAARENRYDVIFMDLEMPEMDGIETTRRIRETRDLATPMDTPIIAVTAYAFAADRKRCMEAGMDAFLPKPINFKELEQILITIRKNDKR